MVALMVGRWRGTKFGEERSRVVGGFVVWRGVGKPQVYVEAEYR